MEIEIDTRTGDRKQKGRGFKEPSELAGRLQGAEFQSLSGGKGGPGAQKSVEGWVLFVTGIHEEAQEEDIHEAFAEYGDIKNIYLNLDRRTGFVKGYALVEYGTREEAAQALAEFNGKELLTQPVHISWAFSSGPLKKERR